MNAKQKIHLTHLEKWAALIKDQAASGLTIKEWCSLNNLSIHKYNYWKHLLKEEYTDSVIPDIVPITLPVVAEQSASLLAPLVTSSPQSALSSVKISLGDITIDFAQDISPELLSGIIKAVRYA